MHERVIAIVGPTAVGKTKLGVEMAKFLNTEVISGDSAQIYKRLDIGTAKITEEEMEGIPHHLIDIKEPTESFSVYEFQQLVRAKITEINRKGKIPILVGGTGLYVRAVLYDYRFSPGGRTSAFEDQFNGYSNEELHQLLRKMDPEGAQEIHLNDRRRILRRLSILEEGEKPEIVPPKLLYDALIIGLNMDRPLLYERINRRVDVMLEMGLLNEVKALYDDGICPNIISYKEFVPYFNGEWTLDEAVETLKKNTRRLAKRQMTFFKNQFDLTWVDVQPNDFNQTIAEVKAIITRWV